MKNEVTGKMSISYVGHFSIIKFNVQMIIPAERTKEFCDAMSQEIERLKTMLQKEAFQDSRIRGPVSDDLTKAYDDEGRN